MVDYSLDALGAVIRERRESCNMTQGELGSAADYKAGAAVSVSRIESGLMRPGPERLDGIARALGTTTRVLEREAAKRTAGSIKVRGRGKGSAADGRVLSIKERVKRIQAEIDRRTTLITELADAFNDAHDRARDEFFMKFVELAVGITGAPQPDPVALEGDGTADPQTEATNRIRWTSYGVASVLAGGAGGAVAGAAVGTAAAYGTFVAAASFGTASTGAAIAGLSGAAATNAALAMLGGGALAAGGAGVAGGTAVLAGIVAAPALLLAVGGLLWMVKRNRKQQDEIKIKLDAAELEIAESQRSFDAVVEILPRSTTFLNYVAVHAGHALKRWEGQLGPRPMEWDSLSVPDRERYQEFVEISANQLAVATIDVTKLMGSRGDEREELIKVADEVLKQAKAAVESFA